MDLNHVSVFVHVVEAGSFTAAGEALGLPKSSVSRTVARLEEELGVRLLQRTTRTLQSHRRRRAVTTSVRACARRSRGSRDAATDASREPRGIVRLTAPVDVGTLELANILARFHAASSVHPRRGRRSPVATSISSRRASTSRSAAGASTTRVLVARKVGSTDFALFASPAYLERKGTPRTLEDLREHECVIFRGRERRDEWRLTGTSGVAERVDVRGVVSGDELVFVRQAIEAGLGIGLLPILAQHRCAKHGVTGTLVRVLPEYTSEGGAMHVVTPTLEFAPLRVTLLRDFLVTELAQLYRESEAPRQRPASPSRGRK